MPLPPVDLDAHFGPRDCLVAPASSATASSRRPDSVGEITSDVLPLRVHWDDGFTADEAATFLASFERTWVTQVDDIGFNAPVLPDTEDGPELDVYLSAIQAGPWSAWAIQDTNVDQVEGDGQFGVSAYIVMGPIPDPSWIDPYVAHEFNHVLQYATDFTEASLPIWEGTATAMQGWATGDTRYGEEIASVQATPWLPLILGDSYTLWRDVPTAYYWEYGGVLWVLHLDEKHASGGGSGGVALWSAVANEGAEPEPDVLEGLAAVGGGGDLGAAMNGIARSRFLVGDDWDDRGLAEGASFVMPERDGLFAADAPSSYRFENPLQVTGQAFLDFDVEDSGPLTVSVSSEAGLQSALLVMWWGADGTVGDSLGADDTSGPAPTYTLELDGLTRVAVAVTNLGPSGFDPDEASAYTPGDQVVTLAWPVTPTDTGGGVVARTGGPIGGGCASAPGGGAVGAVGAAVLALARRRVARAVARIAQGRQVG